MSALPDELVLHILSNVPPRTVWETTKIGGSRQLQSCAEDTLLTHTLPETSLALTFSLSSGSHHRWYDITATLYFCFSRVDPMDKDRAIFAVDHVTPEHCHQTALGKWRRLPNEDIKTFGSWRVKVDSSFCSLQLHDLQARQSVEGEELSVLWRPVFEQYFASVNEDPT